MKRLNGILGLLLLGGIFLIGFVVHAKLNVVTSQAVVEQPATVELSAKETALIPAGLQALPLYAPEALPMAGTFYSLQHTNWPPLPGNIRQLPAWSLGDGMFLVNDVMVDYVALEQEYQAEQAEKAELREAVMELGYDPEEFGLENNSPMMSIMLVNPAVDLWLELTNVVNGIAQVNLHNGTNTVYEIWSRTNLDQAVWDVETAVWPTNGSCMPFTLPIGTRTNQLFLWARDWTGIDENTNGVPDWWEWKHFGNFTQSMTNDYDGDGVNNGTEYTNQTDPNTIGFTLAATNLYVNSGSVPVTLAVQHGHPRFYAVLVNNTNLATATWQPYTTSNLTVTLGTTDGAYAVTVGLKGLPADAVPVWDDLTITRDTVPPVLRITSPVPGSSTTRPFVQIQGNGNEPLAGITYTLTNAAGVLNEPGYVVNQYFDTNRFDFTTNYFQCYDVPLVSNANQFSVRVTDRAGNSTTTNFTLTLDYALATNPPMVRVVWPLPGMAVSGPAFTLRGWLNDDTATVTAQVVATNGTNVVQGLVERGGAFWVEAVPLAGGTNQVTLTVKDAAGFNTTVTNFNVLKSSTALTIDATPEGLDLYAAVGNVSGTVDNPNYAVVINGVAATMNGKSWSATNVPIQSSGTATFTATATPTGGGQAVSVAAAKEMPAAVVIVEHHSSKSYRQSYSSWNQKYRRQKDYVADYQTNALGQWVLQGYHGAVFDRSSWDDAGYEYWWDEATYDWTATNASTHIIDFAEYPVGYFWWWTNIQPYIAVADSANRDLVVGIPDLERSPDCSTAHYYAAGVRHHWTDGTNATYEVTVTARTYAKLFTGGKALLRRQSLFRLHRNGAECYGRPGDFNGWFNFGYSSGWGWVNGPSWINRENLDPATMRVGGHWLGADGNLWLALPDNAAVDATLAASAKHYNANVSPTKYMLHIQASSYTTNANLDTDIPEFCVGQAVSFVPSWSPETPDYFTGEYFWHPPGEFVNTATNYSATCTTYVRNNNLLTNQINYCWYVNQFGGVCSLQQTLHFSNGQSVAVIVRGAFTVYRPQILNNTHSTIGAVILHLLTWTNYDYPRLTIFPPATNSMEISSRYQGNAFITQIFNGRFGNDATGYTDTHSKDVLDNEEIYGEMFNAPSHLIQVFPNTQATNLYFVDAPSTGCFSNSAADITLYSDYVRFQPTQGIPVTIGMFTWHENITSSVAVISGTTNQAFTPFPNSTDPVLPDRSGTQCYFTPITTTGAAGFDSFTTSNRFPVWSGVYYNGFGITY